jgi:hypothetical protein
VTAAIDATGGHRRRPGVGHHRTLGRSPCADRRRTPRSHSRQGHHAGARGASGPADVGIAGTAGRPRRPGTTGPSSRGPAWGALTGHPLCVDGVRTGLS